MLELRRLVTRYVNGGIRYSEFREKFVTEFLAVCNQDAAVDSAVAEIESLCADASEGFLLSEAELRGKLAQVVRPQEAGSPRAGFAVVLLDPVQYQSPDDVRTSVFLGASGTPSTKFVSEPVSASLIPNFVINELEISA